jgi:hypothetical protein
MPAFRKKATQAVGEARLYSRREFLIRGAGIAGGAHADYWGTYVAMCGWNLAVPSRMEIIKTRAGPQ